MQPPASPHQSAQLPPLPPEPPAPPAPPAAPPPPLPPQPWPHVSELLLREARAWAALFGLHGTVVESARKVSAGRSADDTQAPLEPSSEVRESAYLAALTNLAAQADALATEALRVRELRRAKRGADAPCLSAIVQAHARETLGLGIQAASGLAQEAQSASAELRQQAVKLRTADAPTEVTSEETVPPAAPSHSARSVTRHRGGGGACPR